MSATAELDRLCVVLVNTRNPLNIGAAARAMSNFGFSRLRVVKPYDVAWREARSAVGASQVLNSAEEFPNVAEAVADCTLVVGTTTGRDRELKAQPRALPQAGRVLRKHMSGGRVALLFGSEKRGLSNDDLAHCHWLLRIPTRGEHASMNLGQAVAVCLYEIARQPAAAPSPKAELAAGAELERITGVLFEILRESGYVKPRASAATEDKLRRMVRRLKLESGDAAVLLGMLRQIRWKIEEVDSE